MMEGTGYSSTQVTASVLHQEAEEACIKCGEVKTVNTMSRLSKPDRKYNIYSS